MSALYIRNVPCKPAVGDSELYRRYRIVEVRLLVDVSRGLGPDLMCAAVTTVIDLFQNPGRKQRAGREVSQNAGAIVKHRFALARDRMMGCHLYQHILSLCKLS
jgi:hypothetical protein